MRQESPRSAFLVCMHKPIENRTTLKQGRNHVKKVVRNASQGRFAGGGAALFKGAPMPKCTILKMQHSTGAR